MAVTTSEQTAILELLVLMFDAAPGAQLLPLVDSAYESGGRNLSGLADFLDGTGAFLALHPANETPAAFATSFLTPLGLQNDAFARNFVITKLEAGASKADVAFQAYTALHTLPAGAAPQFVAAKAIMENKAEVAAHYSLVLGGSSTIIGVLQAVVHGVTANDASVAAAIDALDDLLATGPALTSGHDALALTGTAAINVTGTVDGDDDGHTATGTLNDNDSVTGNGNTNLVLTVKETGAAPDSVLTHIETVYLTSEVAGDITFDAGDWSDVGAVAIRGGVNGLHVTLNNADAGTGVAVSGATGSFDVDYAYGDGVTLSLQNPTAGESSSFRLQAAGDVDATLGKGALATVHADTSLGDVTVHGADNVHFVATLQDDGHDLDLGDVTASLGSASLLSLQMLEAGGDASLGDVDATLGANGQVLVHVEDVTGDLEVGNVSVDAGAGGDASFSIEAIDGAVTIGDVMLAAAGGAAQFSIDDAAAVAVDDVSLSADDVSLLFSNAASLAAGNVAITAEDSAALDVSDIAGNARLGNVTIAGGDGLAVDAAFGGIGGTLTIGTVTIESGDVSLQVDDVTGNVSVAGLHVTGGDGAATQVDVDGTGSVSVGAMSFVSGDTASLGVAIAGLSATAGAATIVAGETAEVSVDVRSANAPGASAAGALAFGGVVLDSAADASVDVTVAQSVTSSVNAAGSAGAFSAGNYDIAVGDNANVEVAIMQSAAVASTLFVDGDFVVGNVSIAVSATNDASPAGGSHVDLSITKTANPGAGTGGDFTVGNVTLSGGDRADLNADISYDAWFAQMGDVHIGTIALEAGDDSDTVHALVRVSDRVAGDLGDFALAGASIVVGDDSEGSIDIQLQKWNRAGDVGNIAIGDIHLQAGESSDVSVDLDVFGITDHAAMGNFSIGNVSVTVGDDSNADLSGLAIPGAHVAHAGNVTVGSVTAVLGDGASLAFTPMIGVQGALGNLSAGAVNIHAGEGADFEYSVHVSGDSLGDVTAGGWTVVAAEDAAGTLLLSAEGAIGDVTVGNIAIDLAQSASVTGMVRLGGDTEAGSIAIGNVTVGVDDGAMAMLSLRAVADDTSDGMTIGDIALSVDDLGITTGDDDELEVGGAIHFSAAFEGTDEDVLTVGNISIDVAGTADADEVWLHVTSNGDVVIGNITVGGAGTFILDGAAHSATTDLNTSFLAIDAGGDITVGNIDFSAYENDITLDLTWVDHGAVSIKAGLGDDTVRDTAGNNTLAGGKGVDLIDVTQGGTDIIVTSQGDSGKTELTLDSVTGFAGGTNGAGDKLDFNLEAGTAGNYVEGVGAANFAQFIAHANSALNTTVKYFAEVVGTDMLVAVNYGSGEADMVIKLTGVTNLATLSYQNFLA